MSSSTSDLLVPLHVKYIQSLGEVRACSHTNPHRLTSSQSKDDLMYHLTAHLRMNAIYWGLTALCIMGHQDALDREEMIEFVMSCWDDKAGGSPANFGGKMFDRCMKVALAHTQDMTHTSSAHSVRYRYL